MNTEQERDELLEALKAVFATYINPAWMHEIGLGEEEINLERSAAEQAAQKILHEIDPHFVDDLLRAYPPVLRD